MDEEQLQEQVNSGAPTLREQDRYLPIANISRIMKKSLPNNAKIAKDAKECVQECVSEFVSFITSEGIFFNFNLFFFLILIYFYFYSK